MSAKTFDFPGYHVAGDNSPGLAVNDDNIQHFVAGVHLYIPFGDLAVHGLISAQQQLLSRLSACVKSTAHQNPSKRAVCQQSAIFPAKRYTLCHTLVDDIG